MATLAKSMPVHSKLSAIPAKFRLAIPQRLRSGDTVPPLVDVAIHAKLRLEDKFLLAI